MSVTAEPELSAAYLRSVLAAMPAFVVRADSQLRLRYTNRTLHGDSPERLLGTEILSYVAPQDREMVRRVLEGVIASGQPDRYETTASGPHGEPARYESLVTPVQESDGRRGVCIIAVDVTERHRREAELRDREQKLRLALQTTGIGLWCWDIAAGVVTWDDRMREIYGREPPSDLSGYTQEIVHPADRDLVRDASRRILATRDYVANPHRIVRPDGQIRSVMHTGMVFCDEAGAPVRIVGGCVDVTRERALEEEALRGRRMETIGRLSAGLAHNINNMLMVVLPTLSELRERGGPSDEPGLHAAEEAARSTADMVRQLMRLSGHASSAPRLVSQPIGPVVERALRLCRSGSDLQWTLVVDIADDLPLVPCFAAEIEQALVNLLLNARDAFDASNPDPTVKVHVAVCPDLDLGEGRVGDPTLAVCISVEDNGVGLGPTELDRALEPFYTTKSLRGGTGLGLFMADAIVQQHGGRLHIDSQPGKGTRVSVVLPAVSGHRAQQSAPCEPEPQQGLPFRVLVVDDEEAIRRILQRNLSRQGFQVSTVGGVDEASRWLEDGHELDLVLLDRSMPDGPGDRLIPYIRRAAPTAKIVFLTGREVDAEAARRVDGIVFKPVTGDELRAAIDEIMGRASVAPDRSTSDLTVAHSPHAPVQRPDGG